MSLVWPDSKTASLRRTAQHSFFQMLHQGTPTAALDFIAPLRGSWGGTGGQDLALQNCFARGVELGKKLALGIDMKGQKPPTGHGAEGLKALIDYVATHR